MLQIAAASFEGHALLVDVFARARASTTLKTLDLAALDVDLVSPEVFLELLSTVQLSQADLASLGGFAVSTVNRWCSLSSGRADRLAPPRYAVMLVVQFGLLSSAGRSTMRSILPTNARRPTQDGADAG